MDISIFKYIKKHLEALFKATPMSIKEMQQKAAGYSRLAMMTPEAKDIYFMIRQEENIRRDRWTLIFAILATIFSLIALFK